MTRRAHPTLGLLLEPIGRDGGRWLWELERKAHGTGNQYVAARRADHRLGDAAEEHVGKTRPTMRTDGEEIGIVLSGYVEDHAPGIALPKNDVPRCARPSPPEERLDGNLRATLRLEVVLARGLAENAGPTQRALGGSAHRHGRLREPPCPYS